MKKGIKYKFCIWNFTKPKSLFKDGMKPVWLSKKKMAHVEDEEMKWEFIPEENFEGSIQYTKSNFTSPKEKKGLFEKLFDEDQEVKSSKSEGKGEK